MNGKDKRLHVKCPTPACVLINGSSNVASMSCFCRKDARGSGKIIRVGDKLRGSNIC